MTDSEDFWSSVESEEIYKISCDSTLSKTKLPSLCYFFSFNFHRLIITIWILFFSFFFCYKRMKVRWIRVEDFVLCKLQVCKLLLYAKRYLSFIFFLSTCVVIFRYQKFFVILEMSFIIHIFWKNSFVVMSLSYKFFVDSCRSLFTRTSISNSWREVSPLFHCFFFCSLVHSWRSRTNLWFKNTRNVAICLQTHSIP